MSDNDASASKTAHGGSPQIWLYLVIGFGAFWVLYLMFFGPQGGGGGLSAPSLKPPASAARVAFDWQALDLDDHSVDFARFRGRVVFVNIWATWCPPCVAEMPSIANLASNPKLKDIAFVCISTDSTTKPVLAFLRDKKWPMTILRATELPDSFATNAIPATFVLDRDGRVVVSEIGAAQWDDPTAVDFLARLAAQGS